MCYQYKVRIFFILCSKAYFILAAHFSSDQPHFKFMITPCGQRLPYWIAVIQCIPDAYVIDSKELQGA